MSDNATSLPVPAPVPTVPPFTTAMDEIALESTLTMCTDNKNQTLYGGPHPNSCSPVREVDTALSVWYVVLLVAMVILNARIVYKLWRQRGKKQRDLKRRIDHLVGVLCLSDVLMIIPIMLTAYTMGYGRTTLPSSPFFTLWCSVSSFMFGFSSQLSVLIIMFISLLRLISVYYPVKASLILSHRAVLCCMSVSVLIVLSLAIQPYIALEVVYMSNEGICAHSVTSNTTSTTLFLTSTVPYIIPIAVSVLCLAAIVAKMCKIKRVNLNKERHLYSILLVAVQVISAFIVCFIPWIVDGMIQTKSLYSQAVCSSCTSIMYTRHVCKVFLLYFNCLINPFLYGKLIDIGVDRKNNDNSTTSRTALFSASVISKIRDKLV